MFILDDMILRLFWFFKKKKEFSGFDYENKNLSAKLYRVLIDKPKDKLFDKLFDYEEKSKTFNINWIINIERKIATY